MYQNELNVIYADFLMFASNIFIQKKVDNIPYQNVVTYLQIIQKTQIYAIHSTSENHIRFFLA